MLIKTYGLYFIFEPRPIPLFKVKYLHLESSSVALLQAIFIVYFYYPHDIKGDFPMDAENYGTLIKNLRIQNKKRSVAIATLRFFIFQMKEYFLLYSPTP